MLIVAVKAMMPWAMPAIGIPMGVVIWSIWIGLGAQGVKGQDKAHRQDNAQPSCSSFDFLRKKILHIGICYLEGRRLEKVKKYLVNFADSLVTAPLIQDLIDQTGSRKKKTSGGCFQAKRGITASGAKS
jgi:hypothetical protein